LGQAIGELRLTLATQYVSDAIARRKLQEMPHGLSQRLAGVCVCVCFFFNDFFFLLF
jgi:hypothetical protein